MYSVSNNFLLALHKQAREERIRGKVGGHDFTDVNVTHLSYSNRCSDTSDLTLGSAYIGQIEIGFVNVPINRGSWKGQVITLEWGLVLADDSVEFIPIGVFTVTEASWSGTGVLIKASDNIAKFDSNFAVSATNGTPYDLLSMACKDCGVTLGMTVSEMESLPNGREVLSLYSYNDVKTYRDFIGWVAQTCGGFAYCDRFGRLKVKSFSSSVVVDSISEREREYSSIFSDFATSYEGISVVNIDEKITEYYSNGNVGSVINLGSNPFLQFGTKETRYLERQTIADSLKDCKWVPFQSSVLSNMAYDLGDLLTCSGGIAGDEEIVCCIMSIEWEVKNLTSLRGFGADPSLSSGKSKTDKVINGLLSRTSENEVIFYTFENSQEFELGENEEEEIIKIRFATITPKTVNLWHEINLDVTSKRDDGLITCQVFYYLDDELLSYKPVTTWDNDGKHILTLLYFINGTEGGQAHEWSVVLKISGGTATIDRGDIHASLYGQGLVASDNWNGIIEATEEYTLTFGGVWNINFRDSAEVDFGRVESIEATDNYSLVFGGVYQIDLEDDVTIFTAINSYNWIDDNGDKMVDSDGDSIIFVG